MKLDFQRTDLAGLKLPFRIGATSYVIPADLAANAAHLATRVDDMQLVLFDLASDDEPDGPCNVPAPDEVGALAEIGRRHNFSYTVHLIHDLASMLAPADVGHSSLYSARDIIARTRPLAPRCYVLHLDGKDVRSPSTPPARFIAWRHGQSQALRHLARWVDDSSALAVENLEGYTPDFVTPVVMRAGVGRCLDVGHLWLDGHDPLPYLLAALPRTRAVHLHGVRMIDGTRRDHQSLTWMSAAQLDPVIKLLLDVRYTGVLTLEVFEEADFATSLAALVASIRRCRLRR